MSFYYSDRFLPNEKERDRQFNLAYSEGWIDDKGFLKKEIKSKPNCPVSSLFFSRIQELLQRPIAVGRRFTNLQQIFLWQKQAKDIRGLPISIFKMELRGSINLDLFPKEDIKSYLTTLGMEAFCTQFAFNRWQKKAGDVDTGTHIKIDDIDAVALQVVRKLASLKEIPVRVTDTLQSLLSKLDIPDVSSWNEYRLITLNNPKEDSEYYNSYDISIGTYKVHCLFRDSNLFIVFNPSHLALETTYLESIDANCAEALVLKGLDCIAPIDPQKNNYAVCLVYLLRIVRGEVCHVPEAYSIYLNKFLVHFAKRIPPSKKVYDLLTRTVSHHSKFVQTQFFVWLQLELWLPHATAISPQLLNEVWGKIFSNFPTDAFSPQHPLFKLKSIHSLSAQLIGGALFCGAALRKSLPSTIGLSNFYKASLTRQHNAPMIECEFSLHEEDKDQKEKSKVPIHSLFLKFSPVYWSEIIERDYMNQPTCQNADVVDTLLDLFLIKEDSKTVKEIFPILEQYQKFLETDEETVLNRAEKFLAQADPFLIATGIALATIFTAMSSTRAETLLFQAILQMFKHESSKLNALAYQISSRVFPFFTTGKNHSLILDLLRQCQRKQLAGWVLATSVIFEPELVQFFVKYLKELPISVPRSILESISNKQFTDALVQLAIHPDTLEWWKELGVLEYVTNHFLLPLAEYPKLTRWTEAILECISPEVLNAKNQARWRILVDTFKTSINYSKHAFMFQAKDSINPSYIFQAIEQLFSSKQFLAILPLALKLSQLDCTPEEEIKLKQLIRRLSPSWIKGGASPEEITPLLTLISENAEPAIFTRYFNTYTAHQYLFDSQFIILQSALQASWPLSEKAKTFILEVLEWVKKGSLPLNLCFDYFELILNQSQLMLQEEGEQISKSFIQWTQRALEQPGYSSMVICQLFSANLSSHQLIYRLIQKASLLSDLQKQILQQAACNVLKQSNGCLREATQWLLSSYSVSTLDSSWLICCIRWLQLAKEEKKCPTRHFKLVFKRILSVFPEVSLRKEPDLMKQLIHKLLAEKWLNLLTEIDQWNFLNLVALFLQKESIHFWQKHVLRLVQHWLKEKNYNIISEIFIHSSCIKTLEPFVDHTLIDSLLRELSGSYNKEQLQFILQLSQTYPKLKTEKFWRAIWESFHTTSAPSLVEQVFKVYSKELSQEKFQDYHLKHLELTALVVRTLYLYQPYLLTKFLYSPQVIEKVVKEFPELVEIAFSIARFFLETALTTETRPSVNILRQFYQLYMSYKPDWKNYLFTNLLILENITPSEEDELYTHALRQVADSVYPIKEDKAFCIQVFSNFFNNVQEWPKSDFKEISQYQFSLILKYYPLIKFNDELHSKFSRWVQTLGKNCSSENYLGALALIQDLLNHSYVRKCLDVKFFLFLEEFLSNFCLNDKSYKHNSQLINYTKQCIQHLEKLAKKYPNIKRSILDSISNIIRSILQKSLEAAQNVEIGNNELCNLSLDILANYFIYIDITHFDKICKTASLVLFSQLFTYKDQPGFNNNYHKILTKLIVNNKYFIICLYHIFFRFLEHKNCFPPTKQSIITKIFLDALFPIALTLFANLKLLSDKQKKELKKIFPEFIFYTALIANIFEKEAYYIDINKIFNYSEEGNFIDLSEISSLQLSLCLFNVFGLYISKYNFSKEVLFGLIEWLKQDFPEYFELVIFVYFRCQETKNFYPKKTQDKIECMQYIIHCLKEIKQQRAIGNIYLNLVINISQGYLFGINYYLDKRLAALQIHKEIILLVTENSLCEGNQDDQLIQERILLLTAYLEVALAANLFDFFNPLLTLHSSEIFQIIFKSILRVICEGCRQFLDKSTKLNYLKERLDWLKKLCFKEKIVHPTLFEAYRVSLHVIHTYLEDQLAEEIFISTELNKIFDDKTELASFLLQKKNDIVDKTCTSYPALINQRDLVINLIQASITNNIFEKQEFYSFYHSLLDSMGDRTHSNLDFYHLFSPLLDKLINLCTILLYRQQSEDAIELYCLVLDSFAVQHAAFDKHKEFIQFLVQASLYYTSNSLSIFRKAVLLGWVTHVTLSVQERYVLITNYLKYALQEQAILCFHDKPNEQSCLALLLEYFRLELDNKNYENLYFCIILLGYIQSKSAILVWEQAIDQTLEGKAIESCIQLFLIFDEACLSEEEREDYFRIFRKMIGVILANFQQGAFNELNKETYFMNYFMNRVLNYHLNLTLTEVINIIFVCFSVEQSITIDNFSKFRGVLERSSLASIDDGSNFQKNIKDIFVRINPKQSSLESVSVDDILYIIEKNIQFCNYDNLLEWINSLNKCRKMDCIIENLLDRFKIILDKLLKLNLFDSFITLLAILDSYRSLRGSEVQTWYDKIYYLYLITDPIKSAPFFYLLLVKMPIDLDASLIDLYANHLLRVIKSLGKQPNSNGYLLLLTVGCSKSKCEKIKTMAVNCFELCENEIPLENFSQDEITEFVFSLLENIDLIRNLVCYHKIANMLKQVKQEQLWSIFLSKSSCLIQYVQNPYLYFHQIASFTELYVKNFPSTDAYSFVVDQINYFTQMYLKRDCAQEYEQFIEEMVFLETIFEKKETQEPISFQYQFISFLDMAQHNFTKHPLFSIYLLQLYYVCSFDLESSKNPEIALQILSNILSKIEKKFKRALPTIILGMRVYLEKYLGKKHDHLADDFNKTLNQFTALSCIESNKL